jgi:predicted Zn-ribbon and HTH transcriptional regulator
LTAEPRIICSIEHGTTGTKPPAHTPATSQTSAAAKATQAPTATRTEFMAETSLKPLKAILETIREQADYALKQLQESEEERSMRWRCKDCKYIEHFTRPVPLEAAGRCPRCKSISFQCVA